MGWILSTNLMGLVLVTEIAIAYPTPIDLTGKLLRWNISAGNPTVYFEVEGDPTDIGEYDAVVALAAQRWSEVSTSYLSLERATSTNPAQITIKLKGSLDGLPYSAGFAVFDGEDDENYPTHCTIEVLLTNSATSISFAKTVLHELGHCIGLGHSLVGEAIMSYSLELNRFELDIDDVAAVSRLYPVDGSEPRLPPGCGVGHPGMMRGMSGWLLLLPLLVGAYTSHRSGRVG